MVRKVSSKNKRRTRGGRGKGREMCTEKDSICILPDEILCHIVSFLPTKDAVRASILSKRWRYFWTSVTSINIDESLLSGDWERLENPELKGCFMDFVDRVLRLTDMSCLRKVRLSCHAEYDFSRVSGWINIVIHRNVEVLDLTFDFDQEVEPPPSLYTCRKLRSLKLNCLYLWHVPTLVCLPSLKILHLHCIYLRGEDVMKNLLGGCPVLEELDIISSDPVYDMKTLFVRSSSLKNLRIDHRDIIKNEVELGIVIDATNLERLHLICDVAKQCDLYNLSSLVEVKLEYCLCPNPVDDYGNKSVELLRKMSNTKYMCLYYYTMKTLEHARLDDMPMFHNLTHLELHVHEHSWQVLPALLESSPNLITFIFCTVSETSDDKRTLHQKFRRPKCLMLYLEEVKLLSFKGGVDEMKMVSYFLKSAAVLKKMSIESYYSGSKNEEILKRLILFSRSSTACQIVFN